MQQWQQPEVFSQDTTATILSTETLEPYGQSASDVTTMQQWQQPETFSQDTTATMLSTKTLEPYEQPATDITTPHVLCYMSNNNNNNNDNNQVIKFTTIAPQVITSTLSNSENNIQSRQVITSNNISLPVSNSRTSNTFVFQKTPTTSLEKTSSPTVVREMKYVKMTTSNSVLNPATTVKPLTVFSTSKINSGGNTKHLSKQIPITSCKKTSSPTVTSELKYVNEPTSGAILNSTTTHKSLMVFPASKINSGGNTELLYKQIPVPGSKKSSSPAIINDIKYRLSSSAIQALKIGSNSNRKLSSQHSLLKPQPLKTDTNSPQYVNKLQYSNKIEIPKKNPLNNAQKMNIPKLNGIKSSPPVVISKPFSPANMLIMNSSYAPRETSQNVKCIVLQQSSQSRKITPNQALHNNLTNGNLTNLNFEICNDAKILNQNVTFERPKLAVKRGRPKKDTIRPQVAECKLPVPENDQDEFKEIKTRYGRLSRPPAHIVNNYKHMYLTNLTPPDVDDCNGEVVTEAELPKELLPGLEGPKRNISDNFKCPTCKKIYLGRGKMAAHFEKNPDHGSVDQLPPPKPISVESKKNPKPKGKKRGPWATPEEKSARRQANLQKALSDCNEAEISKIVTKPVLESKSLFELMLIKSKSAENVLEVLNNFIKDAREKLIPELRRTSDEVRGSEGIVDSTQQLVCDALGLSPGVYKINKNFLCGEDLSEKEEPVTKKFKVDSEGEEQNLMEHRTSSGFSEGSDNSSNGVHYQPIVPSVPILISNPQIQNELNQNSGFRKVDINPLSAFPKLNSSFENSSLNEIDKPQLASENNLGNESYSYESVTMEDDDFVNNFANDIDNEFQPSYNGPIAGFNYPQYLSV